MRAVFRAFYNNKYYYDFDTLGDEICSITNFGIMIGDIIIDECIIEQSTRLCDMVGKIIYEGDILYVKGATCGDYIVPVCFYENEAIFGTDNKKALQIRNPDDWTHKHDKVDSGWNDTKPTPIVGFGSKTGHRYKDDEDNWHTKYLIEVVGNMNENSMEEIKKKLKRTEAIKELGI